MRKPPEESVRSNVSAIYGSYSNCDGFLQQCYYSRLNRV